MEAETALCPSDDAKNLGWRASLGFVALGVVVSVIAEVLLAFAPPIQAWSLMQNAFDLPGQLVSASFFIWTAVREEIAKALGALSARLRTNRLSWWGVAVLVGASFGFLERVTYWMNWTPEFLASFTPLAAVALDTLAVIAHAAMCVLSVALARTLGGGFIGWSAGIATAGALHAANNLLPRFIDLGFDYAWQFVVAAIMITILIRTFVLRDRIEQRFNRLSQRA